MVALCRVAGRLGPLAGEPAGGVEGVVLAVLLGQELGEDAVVGGHWLLSVGRAPYVRLIHLRQ